MAPSIASPADTDWRIEAVLHESGPVAEGKITQYVALTRKAGRYESVEPRAVLCGLKSIAHDVDCGGYTVNEPMRRLLQELVIRLLLQALVIRRFP
jgi:hypothetical protein